MGIVVAGWTQQEVHNICERANASNNTAGNKDDINSVA